MKLIYSDSKLEVKVGDTVAIRGEPAVVTSIEKPHKPGSTGRVYVRRDGANHGSGYFPSVIGAEWIERNGQ